MPAALPRVDLGAKPMFLQAVIGVNWDEMLKVTPVLAAVGTAIYKFRDARPRRRATLKADLELLNAAREQRLDCEEFESYVQSELANLYRRTTTTDWGTIA